MPPANIGPRERRKRLRMGVAMLAAALLLLAGLVGAGAGRPWRALALVPFWLSALGFAQARGGT